MNEQKRPRSREKRIVTQGKGVQKQGEGLGTGPVNNTGNYEKRREQEAARTSQARQASGRPASSGAPASRPQSGTSGSSRPGPFFPFGNAGTGNSFSQSGSARRPAQTGGGIPQNRPASGAARRPAQTGGGILQGRPASGSARQGTSVRRSSGCGGRIFMLIAVLAVLLGGGKLSGLFDGGSSIPGTVSTGGSGSVSIPSAGQNENSGGIGDLLNALMGSSSSVYDFTGSLDPFGSSGYGSGQTGNGSAGGSVTQSSGGDQPDTQVASGAREKYTKILGNGRDTMTILVYMCGTDLESQNGMGTADLKEMAKASLGDHVNLIVYTGGCRSWRNNVVSSRVNQIYQIRDGGINCLEENMGTGAMTSPATLTRFIQYGKEHFPANRTALILWDHGGGSVSGFGYDEKNGRGSMSLAGISEALKAADVRFDFIGFDACLMATVENGVMLSPYADYMIASEETEPGVGWYYTSWLSALGNNPSMPTVQIGKNIADDFVSVCARQCRGQGTTLSVVDLAELQATLPEALRAFGAGTSELIQQKEYKTVSSARAGAREFAQSSRIDQIDLVHFALNMGTKEGRALADAVNGAVKYNRTGGGMTNAYGLSIYFPYKRTGKVNQAVSAYQAIGMEEEYTRCIQAFASMEISGQVAAGTPLSSYGTGYGSGSGIFGTGAGGSAFPGLMDSLLGGGASAYGSSGTISGGSYETEALNDLLGGLFGGSASGLSGSGLAELFGSRALTADTAVSTIRDNHLDAAQLQWTGNRMTLEEEQWGQVQSLVKNVFLDDGSGFIDLGCDNDFTLEGNDLVGEYDGTWLSINGQPVAYYYLDTVENGEEYRITGYVPAFLNGVRVNLILVFDNENPYGIIAGARKVYAEGETEVQAKNMIQIGQGDRVRFICDYFDYEGNYKDSYYLGDEMTLGETVEIANTPVDADSARVTYCFTDWYQQQYWTPPLS